MKTEQQTSKTLTIGKIAQRYESSKTNAKDNSQNNDDFKAKASRAALIGAAPPNYLLPDCPNDETLLDLKLGYSLLSHHSLYCVGLADDLRRRADRDHRFINLRLVRFIQSKEVVGYHEVRVAVWVDDDLIRPPARQRCIPQWEILRLEPLEWLISVKQVENGN